MKCSECVDIAIRNDYTTLEAAESVREAVSEFPAMMVAQTSMGAVATFVALPMCYEHRTLMISKQKSGLIT